MDAVTRTFRIGPICRPLKRASKTGDAIGTPRNPRLKPGATDLSPSSPGASGFSRGFPIAIPPSRARFSGRQRPRV